MLTSTRRQITYPNTNRLDAPDIPAHIKNVIDNLDIDVFWLSGLFASRPVSSGGSPGIAGRLYYSTDIPQVDLDLGTSWVTVYPQTGISVPIGGAIDWDYAAAGIPSWALLQYGQAINRTTYSALAALAAAASYPHGAGDGSTTFNVADKRGRVAAGKDDMGGVTASRITAAISGTAGTVLGAAVGAEGVTLSSGQIPSHNHTPSDPTHVHNPGSLGNQYSNDGATSGGTNWVTVDHTTGTLGLGGQTAAASTGITIGNTGGGGAHLNTQPTIIVNKILRVL